MRHLKPIFFVATLFTFAATTAPVQAQWSFGGGYITLDMGDTDDHVLFVDDNHNPLCNANELGFEMEDGYELNAQYDTGNGILDFRFICVGGFGATKSLSSDNGIWVNTITTPPPGEGSTVNADTTYISEFYSGELNWITPQTESVDTLFGFRVFQINDELDAEITGGAGGHFFNSVDNRMWGVQTGFIAELLSDNQFFSIDMFVKTGAYFNHGTHFAYYAGGNAFRGTTKTTKLAFGGELAIYATFQLLENLALRGGYDLFVFSGPNSSTDQIPATSASANPGFSTGDVYLQGANIVLIYGG